MPVALTLHWRWQLQLLYIIMSCSLLMASTSRLRATLLAQRSRQSAVQAAHSFSCCKPRRHARACHPHADCSLTSAYAFCISSLPLHPLAALSHRAAESETSAAWLHSSSHPWPLHLEVAQCGQSVHTCGVHAKSVLKVQSCIAPPAKVLSCKKRSLW